MCRVWMRKHGTYKAAVVLSGLEELVRKVTCLEEGG